MAVGQVSANGIGPSSPVGISVVQNGALVKLFYRGEQSGKVKVTIYNQEGEVVYREILQNTESFMRPYNFASLPHGSYTIELRDNTGRRTQKIDHRLSHEKRPAHLMRMKNDNRYVLSVPNKGKGALTVRIFDDHNRVIYEETEVVDGNFARVYNLNNITGEHIFEVRDASGKINRMSRPLR
jgi:hypothetical protein